MADIRGLSLFAPLAATAAASPPPGFTAGAVYDVVSVGIDCLPAAPVLWAMLVDDAGALRAVKIDAAFSYRVSSRPPLNVAPAV